MLMPLSFHSKLPCAGLSPAVLQTAYVKPGASSCLGKGQSVTRDAKPIRARKQRAGTAQRVCAFIAGGTASVSHELLQCMLL